jgi:M6 family metalloprotease-like protein
MRTSGFFASALLCALAGVSRADTQATPFRCAGGEVALIPPTAAAKPHTFEAPLPARGRLKALVVFARFRGEDPAPGPDFAADLFDPDLPGSFAHFYRTMSSGQLQVAGEVLSRRYVSRQPASAYLAGEAGALGGYGGFVEEILKAVDADTNLGLFDSDGPDGLPNSGDDDGWVDYVFVVLSSIPRGFLKGEATGIAGLGMDRFYCSSERSPGGKEICVDSDRYHGALVQQGSFSQTAGAMAHEFGHSLGLPDLYDHQYRDPGEDSAGVGRWCLMGWGAHGWYGGDGPNPLSAWCLEELGWIGPDNRRLREVRADTRGLALAPLYQEGVVCRIPLRSTFLTSVVYVEEYLLLEHRVRSASYYDRHLPGEGVLLWHVRPRTPYNDQEEKKRVDLVCADGLYADAGYPLGQVADPRQGRDNLDFWAHDESYAAAHGGNLGDATDPFDGMRFTRFDLESNPSVDAGGILPAASTGLSLKIQRQGGDMWVGAILPRWAGVIREEVRWVGEVRVDGDLEIAPEGRLILCPGTRVLVAGSDRLASGGDPARCELRVEGALEVYTGRLLYYNGQANEAVAPAPVVFESLIPGERWFGITVEDSTRARVPEGNLVLRGAEYGLRLPGKEAEFSLRSIPVLTASAEPLAFHLSPNYPNPFNSSTAIRLALPAPQAVELAVYDLAGQRVATLVQGGREAGVHEVRWDGRDAPGKALASGTYFCCLKVGAQVETRKLLLVR